MAGDVLGGVQILRDERRRHHQRIAGVREPFARRAVDRETRAPGPANRRRSGRGACRCIRHCSAGAARRAPDRPPEPSPRRRDTPHPVPEPVRLGVGRLSRLLRRHLAVVEHLGDLLPGPSIGPHAPERVEPLEIQVAFLLVGRMARQAELFQERARGRFELPGHAIERRRFAAWLALLVARIVRMETITRTCLTFMRHGSRACDGFSGVDIGDRTIEVGCGVGGGSGRRSNTGSHRNDPNAFRRVRKELRRISRTRQVVSLHRDELILLRERLEHQVLELDLLGHLVRVELEADRPFLDPVGSGSRQSMTCVPLTATRTRLPWARISRSFQSCCLPTFLAGSASTGRPLRPYRSYMPQPEGNMTRWPA